MRAERCRIMPQGSRPAAPVAVMPEARPRSPRRHQHATIGAMIEASLVASIAARLSHALAAPCDKYRPFCVGETIVGWLDEARATRLAAFANVLTVHDKEITFVAGVATPQTRTEALDRI